MIPLSKPLRTRLRNQSRISAFQNKVYYCGALSGRDHRRNRSGEGCPSPAGVSQLSPPVICLSDDMATKVDSVLSGRKGCAAEGVG